MNHPQTCNLDTSQHLIEITEVLDLPMPTMATGSKPAQSKLLFMTSRMGRKKIYILRCERKCKTIILNYVIYTKNKQLLHVWHWLIAGVLVDL